MPSTQAYGGSLVGLIQLRNGKLGVCLSPVFGAVFAAILMMVFSGQLIHGSLFPEFTAERKDEGWTFISFLYWWKPTQATDVAKVLVWAFLAGFAEQFVPDVLDRLLAQSEETPKTSPPLG
jgi:hypothetical protein